MNPFALVDVSFPNIQSRELQNNNFILFCAIQFMILCLTIPKNRIYPMSKFIFINEKYRRSAGTSKQGNTR